MNAHAMMPLAKDDVPERRDPNVERYMQGGCLAFAYALWLAHGRPDDADISILSDDTRDGHGDIAHDATHAFLDLSGTAIDVQGVRSPREMADDLDVDYWSIPETMHPDEAVTVYAGGMSHDVEEGDFPITLYGDDLVDALVLISQHPERYGLLAKEETTCTGIC